MGEIFVLTKRNILRYFRDTGAILFSFLSVFIVAGLYVFFLTDMQINSIKLVTGDLQGIDDMVISWVIGGLVCIPAISVPLFLLCYKVDDTVDGQQEDLLVTPVKRSKIMLGYMVAAWVVGFAMTTLTFALCEVFIVVKGGHLLTALSIIKVLGLLGIINIVFSGFFFFIMLFFKSKSSVMVITSILNTLLGFFLGLFVPVGALSNSIATGIKVFPMLQAASLIRQIMMEESLAKIAETTGLTAVSEIKEFYGVDIIIGGHMLQSSDIIVILIIFGLVFYGGCLLTYKRMKRK